MSLQTKEYHYETKAWSKFLPIIFLLVAVVGLLYVKWSPYYLKAFTAAAKHSIGKSIITGGAAAAPAPSVSAALSYMSTYFKAVWKAVVLGLLLGSLIQVLIPRSWIRKLFGGLGFGSTLAAGAAALPGMMCTCCAAPVTVGLKQRSASINASIAFFLANPVLNPATIIFMGFVLSWKFAIFRVVMGLIMVFGIAALAGRFKDQEFDADGVSPAWEDSDESGNLFIRWRKALWRLIVDTVPAYLIFVALLGAFRAWLFPVIGSGLSDGLLAIIILAVTGTLFVIPTAAEIPIVQSLMTLGLGVGPAATLLVTLPAVSLPSLLIVKRAFPTKVLVFVAGSVALFGIAAGIIASAVL